MNHLTLHNKIPCQVQAPNSHSKKKKLIYKCEKVNFKSCKKSIIIPTSKEIEINYSKDIKTNLLINLIGYA